LKGYNLGKQLRRHGGASCLQLVAPAMEPKGGTPERRWRKGMEAELAGAYYRRA